MSQYCDTLIYHLSTRSQSGRIMNSNVNYKSDMQYTIPMMLNLENNNIDYALFSIDYALIPVSFYNITSVNNTLIIYRNSQGMIVPFGYSTTYTIPIGNYNANQLMTWFNATVPNGDFLMTLNAVNSIFTITNTQCDFTISTGSTCDYIFGFSTTIASVQYNIGTSLATLIMPRCCMFLPTPRINIRCRELGCGRILSAVNSDEVCCVIINNARPNQQINYLNNAGVKSLVKIERMNTFRVRITDDDNNLINFNGVSCFFDFRFDIYYKTMPKFNTTFKALVERVNAETYRKLLLQIENYGSQ